RDLKPSNILVTSSGEPKILDFGVARTTDSDATGGSILNTRTGQLLGTLPYMSPEQTAGGLDVLDTRSDVYSLGIVLYELLTGRLPYELKGVGLPAAARIIQEQDPAAPSSIERALRGDIETILLRTLEKEPERRYQSASALAADLERHLRDEPILARPASTAYALRKFAKRNKALAAGLVIAGLGLGAGLVTATWLFAQTIEARQDARTQEEAAEVQADAMRAVTLILTDLIDSVDPANQGRDARVMDVLRHADSILSSPLVNHPRIELAVRTTLGRVYLSLGDFPDAEVHLREALQLAGTFPENDPTRLLARSAYAAFLFARKDLAEAASVADDVLARQRVALGDNHADTIDTLALLGRIESTRGDHEAGYRHLDDALRRAAGLHGDGSRVCNGIRLDMARTLRREGRLGAAAALAEDVYARQIRDYGDSDPLTIETLIEVGHVALDREVDLPRTTETLWLAYGRAARVLGREHPVTTEALFLLARASLANSDLDASEAFLRDVFDLRSGTLGQAHPDTRMALRLLSEVLIEQGLVTEAEPFIELYLNTEPAAQGDEGITEARDQLAHIRFQAGDYPSALQLYQEVLAQREATLGPDHAETLSTCRSLGETLAALGRNDEAESFFIRAVRGWEQQDGESTPRAVNALADYARFLADVGRIEEADTTYQRMVNAVEDAFPPGFTRIGALKSEYGRFLLRNGRYGDAERYLLDAFTIFQGTLDEDQPVFHETIVAIIELYRRTGQEQRRRAFERQVSGG
ncbi:MAG: serine/threonine protein kinase, partial [Phycisphaerales bacterium]|nr:serine/threonine protein kinase [Phycisphaerales bacterium]